MALELKTVERGLLVDAGIYLRVGELGEAPARSAYQVVVVRALGKLVAHAPVFQRHAA